jgi:hypothetical protein
MWRVSWHGFRAPLHDERGEYIGWRPRQGLSIDALGIKGRPFEGFQVTLGIGCWWRRISCRWED